MPVDSQQNSKNTVCPSSKLRPGRLYYVKKIHKRPHGIGPIVSSCANANANGREERQRELGLREQEQQR